MDKEDVRDVLEIVLLALSGGVLFLPLWQSKES
jgi:hypothetical protein